MNAIEAAYGSYTSEENARIMAAFAVCGTDPDHDMETWNNDEAGTFVWQHGPNPEHRLETVPGRQTLLALTVEPEVVHPDGPRDCVCEHEVARHEVVGGVKGCTACYFDGRSDWRHMPPDASPVPREQPCLTNLYRAANGY